MIALLCPSPLISSLCDVIDHDHTPFLQAGCKARSSAGNGVKTMVVDVRIARDAGYGRFAVEGPRIPVFALNLSRSPFASSYPSPSRPRAGEAWHVIRRRYGTKAPLLGMTTANNLHQPIRPTTCPLGLSAQARRDGAQLVPEYPSMINILSRLPSPPLSLILFFLVTPPLSSSDGDLSTSMT